MAIGKNDEAARRYWGDAYDHIPKSVFALVAWHLASRCSENCDHPGAAEAEFRNEIKALYKADIMDGAQAKRTLAALNR